MTHPDFRFSARARLAADQPISYLMAQAVANPGLISLAAGLVDYDTLPADDTREILSDILTDPAAAKAALQYGTTEGLAPLRHELFQHLARLDRLAPDQLPGSPDNIFVSTGSQQLLHILTDLLVDPGDIVVTAWPSYFVYTGSLSAIGAVVRAVDTDEHGLIPEKLDALLHGLQQVGQLHRVKIVYACTYHQNPTGITLAPDRRPQLLEIVRKYSRHHRILLIEDAAYRELTYQGDPPPSIKRCDADNRFVALLQTFSKPFAPGLKVGYGLLPSDLIGPVSLAKGARDFGSTNLVQHLLLRVMQSGAFDRHVQRLRQTYADKRDAMLDALDKHLGPATAGQARWTHPTGGLYIWLTLPEAIDTSRQGPLFGGALRQGVLFVPGAYCYPPDPVRTPPQNTIRLSFGVPTPDQITRGTERLAAAIADLP